MENLGPEPAYGHGAAKEGKRVGILDLHANHSGQLKIVVFPLCNVFHKARKARERECCQPESTGTVASFLRPTPIILGLFCFCFLSVRREKVT